MRTLAGLFLALGVLLAGCGGDDLDDETGSTRSTVDVAEDEAASAAEIVAAGHPVDADGTTQELAMAPERLAPRQGDLVANDFEEIRALRPDPLTVFAPRPVPRGFGQGWALDAAGRQWYQRVEPEEVLVSGGGGWEPVRAVPVRPGQHLLGFGLTPVGEHVVLPVVRPARGDQIAVDAVAVRRVVAPAATPWAVLGAGPLVRTRDAPWLWRR